MKKPTVHMDVLLIRNVSQPTRTVPYGTAPEQIYDLYLPQGQEHPRRWVVLIHGGFWRAEWDREHLRPLAAALAGAGYAVALVEYARTGMERGGFPGTFHDVASAVAVLRLREVGPDAELVLMGHSAGGQLAAWSLRQQQDPEFVGGISLAGCLDLHMVGELGLDNDAAADLLGASITEHPERWEVTDPSRLGPTAYPLIAVHGDADDRVPIQVARSWWDAAAVPTRDQLLVLEGVGHFELIDPEHPFFTQLTSLLDGLFAA